MAGLVRPARLSAGLVLALALTAAGATTASAHATLVSSNPGNGAVVASAPNQVLLQFDVPVNPRLSAVVLEDRSGQVVQGVSLHQASGESSVLAVDLPPLPRGTYRLDFEARDDTDLHETGGAIVFGIGEAVDLLPQPPTAASPSYLETGTRWLELAGTCLLVGIVSVWLCILPALGRRRPVAGTPLAKLLWLAVVGYGSIALGKAGQLLVATAGLAPGSLASWADATWSVLLDSRFGLIWLAGLGLAGLSLAMVRTALAHPHSRLVGGALGAATGALLAVSSASGHGANQEGVDPLQLGIRVVHLGAAGLWVGGLTVLVALYAGTLRGGSRDVPAALTAFRRFGGLAFIAVGLLLVSGLLLAARGVSSAAALVTTTYGLTLVAKMIAGVAALGFGIRHTMLLTPPRGAGVGGPVRLARSVPFEVGAMLVVLWGAAALGATAPATITPGPAPGVALQTDTTVQVDDLVVHASMQPGRPGANTLFVQIRGVTSTAERPVTHVQVTLAQPGEAAQTVNGRSVGRGRYEFPAVRAAAPGRLDVALSISRADGTLEGATFPWAVAVPPQPPPAVLPATPWAPALDAAAVLLALVLGAGIAARLVAGRRRRALARATAADR